MLAFRLVLDALPYLIASEASLLHESAGAFLWYIYIKYKKTFKNEQRNRDDTAKKRVNTSGVGESNNYYEDIYNI